MNILQEAFSPINLWLTILLILVLVYWLMVIVGGLHLHGDANLDVGHGGHDIGHGGHDVGHGHDAGGHDAGHDSGHDAHHGVSIWASVLSFFHVGHVPLMVILSIMVISMWTFSIIGNFYLNPGHAMLLGAGLLAANFVVSLMVLKVTATPIAAVFRVLDRDQNAPREVVGQVCMVLSPADEKRLGQAEVSNDKGSPLLLNVRTVSGKCVKAGDKAVVIERDRETGVYLVTPSELES